MEMINSNETRLYQNFALVGTTGNGKSTTGNTLAGHPDAFVASDDAFGCTSVLTHFDNHRLRFRVIDTPGFGDNRFSDKQIDEVLCKLTEKVVSWTGESTNQIDGFILVQTADPRMRTIKKDIEHMKDLFGTVSLKSLVIVVIETNARGRKSDPEFFEQLRKMSEVVNLLVEGKQAEFRNDWFVRWDNFNPLPNQLEKLLDNLKRVEPYTHQKFLDSQEEIKKRIDEKIKNAVETEAKKLKELHKNDIGKLEVEMANLMIAAEEEKKRINEAHQRAIQQSSSIQSSMKEMYAQQNTQFQQLLAQMNSARAEEIRIMREESQIQNERARQERDSYLTELRNTQQANNVQMMRMMEEMKNQQPKVIERIIERDGGGGGCFAYGTMIKRMKKTSNIEEETKVENINVGDMVCTADNDGKIFLDEVVLIDDFKKEEKRKMVKIFFYDEDTQSLKSICLTHHHYIFVIRNSKMIMILSRELQLTDILLKLDKNILKKTEIKEIHEEDIEISVKNIITAHTRTVIADGIYCSVHCEGDWGEFFFKFGYFLWKHVNKSIPQRLFYLHKYLKNFKNKLSL